MQEGSDVLLTDLCAICHSNSIKYTCPRCGIHTCSLPCVKRHKSWAQCSGVRDPAAYRKRADLATPASLDQDFNFITSVERSLQHADDVTTGRDIDLVPSGLLRDRKNKFEKAIEERRIRLIKAPKGLSRSRQNKSHWAGDGKGIVWTTEWIHYDGRRRTANLAESYTVEEAFQSVFGRKSFHRRKRKRSDAETHPAPASPEKGTPTTHRTATGEYSKENIQKVPEELQNGESDPTPSERVIEINNSTGAEQVQWQNQDLAQPQPNVHYYLFKPHTTSKVKCVIPVDADTKLTDVLRGRNLLEFPTFHVRLEPPEALSEPFITDEKYNELYGTDVVVNLPTLAPDDEVEEGEVIDLQMIDEKKVLEVLQEDLNG